MASEHDGMGGPRLTALYVGQVVDVADPQLLGRVRVRIPGVLEPESSWAFPLGLPGGGGANRGVFMVPPLGATVGVLFNQGDQDHPYYMAGHYGIPGGARETPGPVGGYRGNGDPDLSNLPAAEAVHVPAWEGDRFVVWADERKGHARLVLRDKVTGDTIEFDGEQGAIGIEATTAVVIKAALVAIEAATITLNGRAVAASGNPIA